MHSRTERCDARRVLRRRLNGCTESKEMNSAGHLQMRLCCIKQQNIHYIQTYQDKVPLLHLRKREHGNVKDEKREETKKKTEETNGGEHDHRDM